MWSVTPWKNSNMHLKHKSISFSKEKKWRANLQRDRYFIPTRAFFPSKAYSFIFPTESTFISRRVTTSIPQWSCVLIWKVCLPSRVDLSFKNHLSSAEFPLTEKTLIPHRVTDYHSYHPISWASSPYTSHSSPYHLAINLPLYHSFPQRSLVHSHLLFDL